MNSYVFAPIFLCISIFISWLIGPVLHFQGTELLVLRIGVLILGVAAALAVFWFYSHRAETRSAAQSPRDISELAILFRSAEQRLGNAQRTGARSLDSLPVFYVLGAPNSAKTTTILKSGLDPELLAGQVWQGDAIIPTHLASIWYAQNTILFDPGETVGHNLQLWNTIVRRTSPKLLRSVFGAKMPLRAAVVCISSDSFLGPNAVEGIPTLARETNTALRQIARQLGSDLPVYVVLTKLDRIAGFSEYVQSLNNEEAAQHVGFSLSPDSSADGVYAERASTVISSSLDKLFFSLGEFRLELLGRDAVTTNIPLIYQFPREFAKLRNNLTNYLVELTRPSQLNTNPRLAGFYCTGLRAQVIEQEVSTAARAPRRAVDDSDATRILSLRQIGTESSPSGSPLSINRRIAQWCFLPRLFSEILLAREVRETPAATSARVSLARCLSLALLSASLLTWIIGSTISYYQNAQLEKTIHDAATALPANSSPTPFASTSQLADLDRLRLAILKLEDFHRNGVPLALRWGLYRGDALIEPARKLYFERFRWLLLDSTQQNIRNALNALPASAPAGADYISTYNPLRAYLITTSFPQYSTADFLTPVLMRFWLNEQRPQTDSQTQLAEQQFHFYSEELRIARPYEISPAMPVVTHARGYLNTFGSFDRIYQNMLAAADETAPAIDFNRLFPGSAATVIETHIVPGSFTGQGFAFMQGAIQHPDRYFKGEDWVLGDQVPVSTQEESLSQKLLARYTTDFSAHWQAYLRSASVVKYRSLADARQKLQRLSAPDSALLALIFTASRNTAVGNSQIAHEFQPTQALVPASLTNRLIAPGNSAYMNGLIALQGAVSQLIQDPSAANNPPAVQPVIAAATAAQSAVSQTAQSFDIDPVAHVEQMVVRLMQEPITSVEESVRGAAPEQINQAGRAFCGSFTPILSKFPFDRNATVEATPAEVTSALKPGTGLLWQFYDANLRSLIVQQGGRWVVSPNATLKPTPQFLQFFNRVAGLSDSLFANGANTPTLNFTAHILQSPGIQSVTLALDSQRLSGSDVTKQFNWTAESAGQAQLIASYGSNNLPLQFSGNWSLFHLVDRGHVEQYASPVRIAYPLEISGTPIVVNGIPLTERIELSGPAANLLTPGSLSGLHCVAQVAR